MPLAERLGALRERDFRLLFAGTMITTVGDRLAGIALAFACSTSTLGSFVLMPLGLALAGPDAIGISETLRIAVAVMWASWAAILALPSVWAIRARPPVSSPSPA